LPTHTRATRNRQLQLDAADGDGSEDQAGYLPHNGPAGLTYGNSTVGFDFVDDKGWARRVKSISRLCWRSRQDSNL
jgi:hypothetical protein